MIPTRGCLDGAGTMRPSVHGSASRTAKAGELGLLRCDPYRPRQSFAISAVHTALVSFPPFGTCMRSVSSIGRLSFAIATRLALRRIATRPPRGFLSVTFDDIPRSAWTEGGRILHENGLRGTYYLSGDLCGRTFEGREQYHRDDVREIVAAGHEIGSHLFHHTSTLGLTSTEVQEEIALNDAFLGEVVGQDFRAKSFAYPYGEITLGAKWQCSRRFQVSRSVREGLNGAGADRDQLRILPIDNIFADRTDWPTTFTTIASERAWAIVLAHGVDDSGHPFSCPPSRLADILRRAKDAGLEILPVAEVMDQLTPVAA